MLDNIHSNMIFTNNINSVMVDDVDKTYIIRQNKITTIHQPITCGIEARFQEFDTNFEVINRIYELFDIDTFKSTLLVLWADYYDALKEMVGMSDAEVFHKMYDKSPNNEKTFFSTLYVSEDVRIEYDNFYQLTLKLINDARMFS